MDSAVHRTIGSGNLGKDRAFRFSRFPCDQFNGLLIPPLGTAQSVGRAGRYLRSERRPPAKGRGEVTDLRKRGSAGSITDPESLKNTRFDRTQAIQSKTCVFHVCFEAQGHFGADRPESDVRSSCWGCFLAPIWGKSARLISDVSRNLTQQELPQQRLLGPLPDRSDGLQRCDRPRHRWRWRG